MPKPFQEDRAQGETERTARQAARQESDALFNICKTSAPKRAADAPNHAAAAHGYRTYFALHPQSARTLNYLAHTLLQMGDLHGSLRTYRDALRLAGSNTLSGAAARLGIAAVLQEQGQTEAALCELHGIIDEATPATNAVLCPTFLLLGDTYHKAGRRPQARAAWKQVVEWGTTTPFGKRARELLNAHPEE